MPWTIGLLVSILLLAPVGPEAEAGCVRGTVVCTNMTAMRTCSATLMCDMTVAGPGWNATTFNPMNVTACSPMTGYLSGVTVTFNLVAMAMTTAPTSPRACNWDWSTAVTGSTNGQASIETVDGLPVELMDFSVEPGEGRAEQEHAGPDKTR